MDDNKKNSKFSIDYDSLKPEDKWDRLKIPDGRRGKKAVPDILNVIKRWLLEDSE